MIRTKKKKGKRKVRVRGSKQRATKMWNMILSGGCPRYGTDTRTFGLAESAVAGVHGSPPPCWVDLDGVVREWVGPDNLEGVGLAHVR
jgi:hypothetical protein